MSEYGGGHHGSGGAHVRSPINVGWVILASLLIGVGLFFIFWWLYNFNLEFTFGIAMVVVGAFMLMDRRAGLDHA
jgi:hypothetical protein